MSIGYRISSTWEIYQHGHWKVELKRFSHTVIQPRSAFHRKSLRHWINRIGRRRMILYNNTTLNFIFQHFIQSFDDTQQVMNLIFAWFVRIRKNMNILDLVYFKAIQSVWCQRILQKLVLPKLLKNILKTYFVIHNTKFFLSHHNYC